MALNYIVGAGGLIGTLMVAIGLFGMDFVYPRWKRWLVLLVGLAMAATFWIIRPQIGHFSLNCDPYDGGKFDPSC